MDLVSWSWLFLLAYVGAMLLFGFIVTCLSNR